MIFIKNKYTNWYLSIIEKAKNRNSPNQEYGETHHIIPKSLGGNNKKENLIWLTAKEHFICHLLLPKMVDNLKHVAAMRYALFRMSHVASNTEKRYKINSNSYKIMKAWLSKASRFTHLGRKDSDETRRKKSIAMKGKPKLNRNKDIPVWNKGIPMTKAAKEKASNKLCGRTPWNKGVSTSALINEKRSSSTKGIPKEKVTCPKCGKTGGKPVMVARHFDNCGVHVNRNKPGVSIRRKCISPDGIIFDSISKAAKYQKIPSSCLAYRIKNGLTEWKFYNP